MRVVWNDSVRAAFMELVRAIFPMFVIYGVYNFTDIQIAATTAFISILVTFLGLIFKGGQQPGNAMVSGQGSETAPTRIDLLHPQEIEEGMGGPPMSPPPEPPKPVRVRRPAPRKPAGK